MAISKDTMYEIRRKLADCLHNQPYLWQMRLLDQKGIGSFAEQRSLSSFFMGDHIIHLWKVGLIQADIIESTLPLEIDGLDLLDKHNEEEFIYSDLRYPEYRGSGYVKAFPNLHEDEGHIRLLFHPFRYYPLYWIDRSLELPITPYQLFYKRKFYHKALDNVIDGFERRTSNPDYPQQIQEWNDIAALAILIEPRNYLKVFGRLSYQFNLGFEGQLEAIDKYWEELTPILSKLSIAEIEEVRKKICIASEMLDPNKEIHTLIRLSRGAKIVERTKGKLGGSMLLQIMAEFIRRSTEEIHQEELPEEDELGFGLIPDGIKKNLYGSNRIIDSTHDVKTQWFRMFGIESGVRIRWYVEGETEYYALDSVLGRYMAIELVNLHGQVIAKRSKGVSFRESLRSDKKAMLFSLISIDGDRSDYVKAVKLAVNSNDFMGRFFISSPDFEYANFINSELEEIIWQAINDEKLSTSISRGELHEAIRDASTGSDLDKTLKSLLPGSSIHKSKAWGERLAAYAWQNSEFRDPFSGIQTKRPFVESIEFALRTLKANFKSSLEEICIDPETGEPRQRANNAVSARQPLAAGDPEDGAKTK